MERFLFVIVCACHVLRRSTCLLLTSDFVCLFDLILYVPINIFSVISDVYSWVEPELSKDKCVLLKDTTQ